MTGMFSNLRSALKKRREYNTIVSELSALSERELEDLGLNRSSAQDIARSHVYGR